MEEFTNWFLSLNRFSALAGCLFFLYTKQSLRSVSGIVFLILVFSFAADNINYFFIRFIYPNSFYIGNSWVIGNFFLMILLFRQILPNSSKSLIQIVLGFFVVGTIISLFFFEFDEANTFTSLYCDLSYILLALVTYLQLLKNPSQKLITQPVFWLATSFFVHSSLILLQSVFDNYLIFDQNISMEGYFVIYSINLSANITKNFILFYALVLISRGFPDKVSNELPT